MTNHSWIELISSEFRCSKSCAKEMLHAMYEAKRRKEVSSGMSSIMKSDYNTNKYSGIWEDRDDPWDL